MAKAKLPRQLRQKITDLFDQGFTSDEILGIVIDEAKDYVSSHDEVLMIPVT